MAHGARPAVAGWLGFVHGQRVLAVATGTDEFVASAWAAIQQDDAFQAILDLLTRHGLASTPDFVLIEWSGDGAAPTDESAGTAANARVILRGAPSLDVTDATGTHTLSAKGIATWVERTLSGVSSMDLTILGTTPSRGELPFVSGVTQLAGLRLDLNLDVELGGAAADVGPADDSTIVIPASERRSSEKKAAEQANVGTDADEAAQTTTVEETTAPPEFDVEATMVSKPESTEASPAAAPEHAAEPAPAAAAEADPAAEDAYDYLFGETVHRPVSAAAVHAPEEPEAAAPDSASDPAGSDPDGIEHDGQTVLTSDVLKLRRSRTARGPAEAPRPEATPNLVLVASPGGTRERLGEPLLVGRAPSVSQVSGGALPRLLTIGGPDQDISRNHAQFTLEGGTVVVTDLHSKNGTTIVLPGKDPQTLRAGEPTAVIVGSVIDLGGGITFTVEEE